MTTTLDHDRRTERSRSIALIVVVALDAALTLALEGPMTAWGLARMPVALVLAAALWWRRRHHVWLVPAVLLANMVPMSFAIMIACVYTVARRSRRRLLIAATALLALATALVPASLTVPHLMLPWSLVIAAAVACSTAIGLYARARADLLDGLRQRAEEAERGRTAAEESARRAERTRIAREMHDIVAHKISLVALQAGALEINPNLDREQVLESAGLIRSTATQALTELREVLGVLRGAEEAAPLAPQPTWDDVRRLVDSSKEAGVQVDLFDFVADPVPNALARTAYRVVQEGLTNIHKHARLSSARVALIGDPASGLTVEVSNSLPRGYATELPGARMGLSGIETRVAHAGGTITSGPSDDGRFVVRAVLPWPAE